MDHPFVPFFSSGARSRLCPPAGLLRRIRGAEKALRQVPREDLSPAGCWIEDHARFLTEEAEEVQSALRFSPYLPAVGGVPRVLILARDIVRAEDGALSAALILRLAREKAGDAEWTQAEWGLLPRALACALFERLMDTLLLCEKEFARCRLARAWAESVLTGKGDALPRDLMVLEKGMALLAARENADALRRVDELLSQEGLRADDVAREAQEQMNRAALKAGRAIRSLRLLPRLPLDRILERLNPVARILREEDTYRRMDERSRGYYQQRVALLARRLRVRETAVARAALALAQGKEGIEGEAGYYLEERGDRIAAYLLKRRAPALSLRHRQGLFLLPLYGGAALALGAAMALGTPAYLWPLVPLCASEVIRPFYFALLRRRFPARMLPRIRLKRLDRDTRTLVAVPTLLTSRKQALQMVRQLAVLRSANPDPYLDFMLLADFADSPLESRSEDAEILEAAKMGLDALNRQQGGGFYYMHRARAWDAGQRCFTGRERKRGALEELNHLLTDGKGTDAFLYASCDVSLLCGRYAYVITLDADTFLPPGAACQLVGTMLHPLQKGRVGVVQPRMEVAADTVKSRVQLLWGGIGGVDPYHTAAQDIYQDLFRRGSFVGKGIYEPRAWLSALKGRLPRGRLLSHDLIEGEITGSALAPDIVLYDGHPASVAGWQKRLHRWTRGDWQLMPFLKDRRLSLLSRHKIWDNLRRSLAPLAQVLLLLAGAGLNRPLLFLLALPWPLRGMPGRLMPLPGKALTLLDAAARAVYRQFVSHRGLLSWVTAAQAESGGQPTLSAVLSQVLSGTGLIVLSLLPGGFLPGAFAGLCWVGASLLKGYLDGPAYREKPLTSAMRQSCRGLARDTWRFFADSVSAKTLFLPPDSVQSDPDKGPAMRTSPTNIGLYLLSCCAARELGFLSSADWARRLNDTLRTLEKLKTWKGHFYNWYDLTDGEPLPPRFVSTVDSGNLAGCLLACAQLCRARLAELPEEDRALPRRLDALFARMDFSALYDASAGLFRVGWDAQARQSTPAHYDLLASEARLTSFIAVMTRQVPLSHWARLGRRTVQASGGPALLSWGGTMFEYLMPQLLLPLTRGTLLGEGCLNAVRAQMAYRPDRPFGISESGYYAFDPDLNYQYKAFGLPLLALSGETAGSVTAPYASILALPFFPRAAAENLLRMQRLGWQDRHGLFEAVDYSPQRMEKAPRIVRSHMAHHQGMILCALCNALEDQVLVRAFMAPPRARAFHYLLLERAPRKAPRRHELPPPREETPQPGSLHRSPRPGLPLDAQALFGGGTTWVLSPRGQGYLAHRGMMITRFDPEAGAQTGPQFYLRSAGGACFRPAAEGSPVFEAGSVRFSARWEGLRVQMDCCISPLSGTAVTRIQLENPGKAPREAEVISFLEIAQGGQAADAAHPNFRDLSVRVEEWGSSGLISRRLPRDAQDETPLIGHAVVGDAAALCRQGDRTLFLGREGSLRAPDQAVLPAEKCVFRWGDVIAPCLSLRVRVRAAGGGKCTLLFLTAVGKTEGELRARIFPADQARSAFALSATQARMTLRFLRMDGRMLAMYQLMLGALVFSGQPHQALLPSAPRDALWRRGIAGELPLLLVRVAPEAEPSVIRHALRAHAWMRMQGVWTDLVFFCPEEDQYRRPAWDTVQQLLSASPSREWAGIPGGVYVTAGNETEAREMESLARLTLYTGQMLDAQLSALRRMPPAAERRARFALPRPVAPPPLEEENSYGGFAADGSYCVTAPAPAPWHNLLCGPEFGTLVCETGILHSYAKNSRLGRITRLCPDVHRAPPSEEIYLMDGEGCVYPLARCTAAHEPGVTVYRTLAGKILAELSVFSHAGRTLGVRSLTLRSEEKAEVQLFYLVRFALGEQPEGTRCQAREDFVLARSGDMGVAWCALDGARCQALSPAVSFGLGQELIPPALLSSPEGLGSVAFLKKPLSLRPREPLQAVMALGFAPREEQAREDYQSLLAEGPGAALRAVRAFWADRLSALTLFSGDARLERMMNLWLPYQARSSRLMARMGPYQPGGAFGFRDQLQDLLILLPTDPQAARAHILLCAAHQFPEGDVQHWWHAPQRGVRTRISDDRLFLPYLTARYIRVTGDSAILNEPAPYLQSAPLSPGEADRYEAPPSTPWQEPLFHHCLRALDSVALGSHDLPLMGGGDWNDGMNRVGGEKGESVWLGFFLVMVLRLFAPLCPAEVRERLDQLRRRVLAGAENAWTGKWYLRAWYDSGEALGGPESDPPRIDLISQCFAVLAGAPREHAREALAQAVDALYDREAGIVKLLSPPFTPREEAGYIGAYLPGVRENGGQYTHAVPWLVMALCQVGEYRLAWEITRAILPAAHSDTRGKAAVYRVEPYVLAGDVYEGENRGRGGWTWYTGSAAWLYDVLLTVLLGFDKQGDRARLSPCPEPDAEEYTLLYRFGNASYQFTAARDVLFPTLDGEKLTDGWVTLRQDGRTHEARFPMR